MLLEKKTIIELVKHFVIVEFLVYIECGIGYRLIFVLELGGKINVWLSPSSKTVGGPFLPESGYFEFAADAS